MTDREDEMPVQDEKTEWSIVAKVAEITDDGPHHVSADGVDAVLVRVRHRDDA